ncbi:HelD family protein [Companilactobacillus hulinensis]|uniref:HelD family protein n=1 Tax=Companilactobacillus hulinensis TaxID=2486007 RepID=UPI000F76EFE4|nr:UvrD-helicase domain-containing protein [Companilactobacillus hulinensis]
MNDIFKSEQNHLTMVHGVLKNTLESIDALIADNSDTAKNFKKGASKDTALNFDSYADNLDTFAAIETMNKQIDYFNNRQDQLVNTKEKVIRLLPAPYFARIDLKYPDETKSEPFYIGSAGFSPTPEEPMILDWRSPIADLYYNNRMGQTFYEANNRKIEVNVDTRRQFLLHDAVLQDVFDTDVAIQDPLLVKTLQENKNSEMGSITATIQREQNIIIRDTKSQALLVNGIAGSGKTSVVLQRIAYLLYRYRDDILSNDVLLLTPNPLFTNYINKVLPSLGEESPLQMTFDQMLVPFVDPKVTFTDNNSHVSVINEQIDNFHLPVKSFRSIKMNGKMIFSKNQIKDLFDQTPATSTIGKRITALTTVLTGIIEEQIELDSRNGKIQAELSDLTDLQQEKIYGRIIAPNSDSAVQKATKKMLQYRNRRLLKLLEQKKWLNIEKTVQLILNSDEINQLDYAFAKLKLLNLVNKNLKFVMIDEIQDYSLDQILFMITAYPKVKWTLVGDQFQSIKESNNPLTFVELQNLFEKNNISVTQRNLYTSYRSSGEITNAFVSHGSAELINNIKTIQIGGKKPEFITNNDFDDLLNSLKSQVSSLNKTELSAIITSDNNFAEKISENLSITAISNEDKLPQDGVIVLPLVLAKGLEFDNVIIADAESDYYHDKRFGENRLYTAFSRASKLLIVNSTK